MDELTWRLECIAAEQDAEARLEIESAATVARAARIDAIAELERVGPRLQDLFGRGEHEARHEFERRVLTRALERFAGLRAHVAQEEEQERSKRDDPLYRRHAESDSLAVFSFFL